MKPETKRLASVLLDVAPEWMVLASLVINTVRGELVWVVTLATLYALMRLERSVELVIEAIRRGTDFEAAAARAVRRRAA